MKYYFENKDSELCYMIDYFKEELKERGLTEISVYPAKIMIGSDFYYCQELGVSGEKGDSECGKWCEYYEPRNKKSGRCRHSAHPYEASNESIIIKL